MEEDSHELTREYNTSSSGNALGRGSKEEQLVELDWRRKVASLGDMAQIN